VVSRSPVDVDEDRQDDSLRSDCEALHIGGSSCARYSDPAIEEELGPLLGGAHEEP
jgi:hypothetical protein